MRIGNLTILMEQNNYGQRLQTYALQQYLKTEFGAECVTLDYHPTRRYASINDGKMFHRFEKECLNLRRLNTGGFNVFADCDKIIVGGDQVLNPVCMPVSLYSYITKRAHVKRNAFTYGAGLNNAHSIPWGVVESMSPHTIAYGTREDCANMDYVKVLDPVFLLHGKWGSVANGNHSRGGTVTYTVVGGKPAELSLSYDGRPRELLAGARSEVVPDPRAFIELVMSAGKVVTNSYHGLAFALMMGVPKVVVKNPEDHRVANLISMLGVRFDGENVVNHEDIFKNIEKWRKRSHDFIERCLEANPHDYCAVTASNEIRAKSSSGGVCPELALKTFESGGVVYGGAYSADFKKVVTTRVVRSEDYFSKLSKSKYSFCLLPNMEKLKNEIMSGTRMLFIGSPCQINAVKKYVGHIPDTCVLCDFKCRGFSRQKRLEAFVDMVQADGEKVTSIDFRPNHRTDQVVVSLGKRNITFGKSVHDSFVFNTMERCKSCPYAHGMLSEADITIGDFWRNREDRLKFGKNFMPENGCSSVSVNTQKGQGMFNSIKDRLVFKPLFG